MWVCVGVGVVEDVLKAVYDAGVYMVVAEVEAQTKRVSSKQGEVWKEEAANAELN